MTVTAELTNALNRIADRLDDLGTRLPPLDPLTLRHEVRELAFAARAIAVDPADVETAREVLAIAPLLGDPLPPAF